MIQLYTNKQECFKHLNSNIINIYKKRTTCTLGEIWCEDFEASALSVNHGDDSILYMKKPQWSFDNFTGMRSDKKFRQTIEHINTGNKVYVATMFLKQK